MIYLFFIKRKTAYDMRISYWSSDVCSSDLEMKRHAGAFALQSDTAARRHCGFLLAQRDRVGYGFAIQAEQHIAGTQAGMVGRAARSEDGRVGKECVSSCLSWWSPDT